jgi:hypothetical protein
MKDELFNNENDGAIVRKSADTIVNLQCSPGVEIEIKEVQEI